MKNTALALKSLLKGLVFLCVLVGNAQATTVQYPRLEISTILDNGDTGVTLGSGNSTISIDSTVTSILTEMGGSSVTLSQEDFTLNATLNNGTGLYEGTLTAGSYLSASFTGLTLNPVEIYGGLTYTGGSLQGSYTEGDIVLAYSGVAVAGVIGPVVVPVPAAVWLFGSGLIALVSVARRK